MTTQIFKSFGTVLKGEQKEIDYQISNLPTIKKRIDLKLPENFNGQAKWIEYLSNIREQGTCGNCWAYATADAASDRWSLYSNNDIHEDFSVAEFLSCGMFADTKINLNQLNKKDFEKLKEEILYPEKIRKCDGNSIYNALCYLYIYGVTDTKCVDIRYLRKSGFNFDRIKTEEDIPKCSQILGKNYDICPGNNNAPRFYRIKLFYQVNSEIESIKYEIFKYGPVVAGMRIYSSFINKYDGTTIYNGPNKDDKDDKPLGGHAIRILGWGKENGVDYWLCANSWGIDWGLGGYFKIKMGIQECQLEDNIYGMIPDIPNISIPDYLNIGFSSNTLTVLRDLVKINPETGYKVSTVKKIMRGDIRGDLTYLVNPGNNIDLASFIAANVLIYNSKTYVKTKFPLDKKEYYDLEISYSIYFLFFVTAFIIVNIIFNKIKRE